MAAGQGYIEFATGDVLTAAAANGYLASQVVMVFADSAARTTGIATPQEGMLTYLKDTNAVEAYDGAAWISIGSTGDITGVTAGTGISGGGTSGTVTVTNSMATAIDAKGDLIIGTGADTFSRLAVGTDAYVLTADSTAATGVKWAAAGGGGSSFPAFSAYKDSTQTPSAGTWTKILFAAENFDTANNFASSRFTPTTAGYYQINAILNVDPQSSSYVQMAVYKNGTQYSLLSGFFASGDESYPSGSCLVPCNGSTDYLEIYARSGATLDVYGGATISNFNGVGIRGL